ncbi:MAG: hypothetical protein Q9163_006077 [Psora crenata]
MKSSKRPKSQGMKAVEINAVSKPKSPIRGRKHNSQPTSTAHVTSGPAAASSSNAKHSKPSNPNTNSKHRAKARKQGNLSALLEKSKQASSASSGLGLDLMDLMKQD